MVVQKILNDNSIPEFIYELGADELSEFTNGYINEIAKPQLESKDGK